jgi:hypothetical protein
MKQKSILQSNKQFEITNNSPAVRLISGYDETLATALPDRMFYKCQLMQLRTFLFHDIKVFRRELID